MASKKKKQTKLTPGEMEIMSALWNSESQTIAETREALGRPIGYTTVQTRLNRLVEKGLVKRSAERPARYRALITADHVGANHLEVLIERVAGGSVVPLVAHLVKHRSLSDGELDELKEIIRTAEKQSNSKRRSP